MHYLDEAVEITLGKKQEIKTIVNKRYIYDIHNLASNWWLSGSGYIHCRVKGKSIFLHKFIYSLIDPDYEGEVDHKPPRNKLDNRVENLRPATRSQQLMHTGLRNDNTSGHKGIHICKNRYKKYLAHIEVDEVTYQELFHTLEEALAWRRSVGPQLHGEFYTEE